MKLVRLRAPGGLENLKLVEEDHPKPRPDELLVRIRARSLNFHDDMVVLGKIPCADGRIPLSDGAGEVIAVAGRRNERPLPGGIYLEITAVFRWKKSSLPSSISNPKKHFGSRVFDGRFLNPPVGQLRPRIGDSCNQSVNPVNPVKRLPLTKKIKRGRTDRDSSPCSRPRQSR